MWNKINRVSRILLSLNPYRNTLYFLCVDSVFHLYSCQGFFLNEERWIRSQLLWTPSITYNQPNSNSRYHPLHHFIQFNLVLSSPGCGPVYDESVVNMFPECERAENARFGLFDRLSNYSTINLSYVSLSFFYFVSFIHWRIMMFII